MTLTLFLQRRGRKVGIITNDQASGLVDTALAEELDLPVREISGGCFCCRSDKLIEALEEMEAIKKPDVFIAEPVGSCTDLITTVVLPLKITYKKTFEMAPYAVLIDPFRALQTLTGNGPFSADITYIYRKQLEEAEIIVINKLDVVPSAKLKTLRELLTLNYPEARLFEISARSEIGLDQFFEALHERVSAPKTLIDVYYTRYGIGEAQLGWYNASFEISSRNADGKGLNSEVANACLLRLASRLKDALNVRNSEIAHFKAVLRSNAEKGFKRGLASVNFVRSYSNPELGRSLSSALLNGTLLLNLRAEAAPEVLEASVEESLQGIRDDLTFELKQKEVFRPGQPKPIHRVTTL